MFKKRKKSINSNNFFEEVWNRIVRYEGEVFRLKNGDEFTYEIDGNGVVPSRTEYRISKSDFKKAYNLVPFKGPGVINTIVRGPSYVWAILHDPRIS